MRTRRVSESRFPPSLAEETEGSSSLVDVISSSLERTGHSFRCLGELNGLRHVLEKGFTNLRTTVTHTRQACCVRYGGVGCRHQSACAGQPRECHK